MQHTRQYLLLQLCAEMCVEAVGLLRQAAHALQGRVVQGA
jgi:hypothetical protein